MLKMNDKYNDDKGPNTLPGRRKHSINCSCYHWHYHHILIIISFGILIFLVSNYPKWVGVDELSVDIYEVGQLSS